MRKLILGFSSLYLLFSLGLAQGQIRTLTQEVFPESNDKSEWYTVKGERHGPSFFKKHQFEGVEYKPGDSLTFDRFHTTNVSSYWLEKWAQDYPDLVDLYEVARSFEGRPILQLTLTNKKTGKDVDKPAAYFEGGRHSGEVTASESALWLVQYLLQNYGKDEQITQLLDTKAIYVRPVNNPDGSNLYLNTAERNRSTVRPHDSDDDGLVDEDPEEDLDGDGVVYTMRWKVREGEEDKGNAIIDPRDPTGRLMKRVLEGKGDWRVVSEGIDNDGDGKFNEDGIGGLDLHRNYPENWRPEKSQDATQRGYTQFGAGAFPMSENETKSVAMWMLTHPNISVVNSMDTSVPMHLRPPSTSRGVERMYPEDLAIYEHFDKIGRDITSYPWAGDVYEVYMTRYPNDPVTGDPNLPSPLFGHGPDFGYFYLGAVWYGDELWNGGRHKDFNEDGLYDDYDSLQWDESENQGRGFKEWETFQHPTLGQVEIGGFHPKFFSQNAPPDQLEKWVSAQGLFNLAMALELPQLTLENSEVKQVEAVAGSGEATSRDFSVSIRWKNTGQLPVALKQAQLVKIVQEDRAELSFEKELTKGEHPTIEIITPSTHDKTIRSGYTAPGETKEVQFVVRVRGDKGVEGKAKILSTRGGLIEIPITFDPED